MAAQKLNDSTDNNNNKKLEKKTKILNIVLKYLVCLPGG